MAVPVSDIFRFRGDTIPEPFLLTNPDGSIPDITTGYTFQFTLCPFENPATGAGNLFEVAGVVTDGPAGLFEFPFTAEQMDLEPAVYFYDVTVVDPSGGKKTLEKGRLEITQDLNKD